MDDYTEVSRSEPPHYTWLLSDSRENSCVPPLEYVFAHRSCLLIQATSPGANRWGEWTQQRHGDTQVMQPWSWEELVLVREEDITALSKETLRRNLDAFEPSGRLCLTVNTDKD